METTKKVEIELVEIPERVANYVEKNSLKEIINNIHWINKNVDPFEYFPDDFKTKIFLNSYLRDNFEKVLKAKINGYVVKYIKKYVIKFPLLSRFGINGRYPEYLCKQTSLSTKGWSLNTFKDNATQFTLDEIRYSEELAPLEKFAVPVEDMEDKHVRKD